MVNKLEKKENFSLLVSRKTVLQFFIFIILYILNSLGAKIPTIGLVVATAEWGYLIFCWFHKRFLNAFLAMIVFITTSMETTIFTVETGYENAVVYSIYSLPLVRSLPFYFMVIFLAYALFTEYRMIFPPKLLNQKALMRLLFFLPILFFSSVLTGCIVYLLNDNGVADSSWYFTNYIQISIKVFALMALIFSTLIIVVTDERNRYKLEKTMEVLLISCVFATTITLFLGWRGYYGSKGSLILMPLSASICSVLILFSAFKKNYKFLYFAMGLLFTLEIIFVAGSQMGSKFYIIPFSSFCVFLFVLIKNGRINILIGLVLIVLLSLFFSGLYISSISFDDYTVWKFSQLLRMFDFKTSFKEWYLLLDNSPRFRIDEFMSILYEYIQKPWFFLFGKGVAGTVTHHWGITIWDVKGSGAFSDYEIESGIYMFMHESLNVLFLRHGLLGLIFFITTMMSLLKRLDRTPWALVGFIWMFLYWGIYRSWWIGAIALVVALFDVDEYHDSEESISLPINPWFME